jgi:calnexin
MQNDILFDNIYIGHSIEDAEKLKAETYDVKNKIETAEEEASKPKEADTPKSPMDLTFMDDPVHYVREKLDLFITIAKGDPIQAIKFMPEVAGAIGTVFALVLAVAIGLMTMSGASTPPQVKKAAENVKKTALDTKDQVVDAAASGSEKIQAEVNKRTTRSSGPAE